MLNLYNHLSWSFFLFTLFSFSLLILVPSSLMSPLYLSIDVFSVSNSPLSLAFYFDFMSCSFVTVVLLISSIIMGYSFNYMAPYSKSNCFIWLTFLFVVSMLLIVCMSNLFFIMLGWDGLGLVSFFLIVYYQNQSSITSGLFTLFMNRLGDCFFLLSLSLSIALISIQSAWVSTFSADIYLVATLLCATFMTNSAIFPFSPWLPLAIAAPTPISALVHSSTLVTSGLYLIMRYSHLLLSVPSLSKFLIVSSIFTSFYAGLNSLVEQDLNNLIALSTLSHLGFISLSFSSGLVLLGFFHLLTHAMFNSLLFIAIGDTMINLSHSQDIRYLSSGSLLVPGSSSYIQVSCLSLLGLPSTSGFFSNDLVLETLNFSDASFALSLLIYINVGFTFFYTFQLVYFCLQPLNISPINLVHPPLLFHSVFLTLISICSVVFGAMFLLHVAACVPFLSLPLELKMLPIVLLLLFTFLIGLLGNQYQNFIPSIHFYFSSIINLLLVCMRIPSNFSLTTSTFFINSLETGMLNFIANVSPYSLAIYLSRQEMLSKSSAVPFISLAYAVLLLSAILI